MFQEYILSCQRIFKLISCMKLKASPLRCWRQSRFFLLWRHSSFKVSLIVVSIQQSACNLCGNMSHWGLLCFNGQFAQSLPKSARRILESKELPLTIIKQTCATFDRSRYCIINKLMWLILWSLKCLWRYRRLNKTVVDNAAQMNRSRQIKPSDRFLTNPLQADRATLECSWPRTFPW